MLVRFALGAAIALAFLASAVTAKEPIRVGLPLSMTGSLADSAAHIQKAVTLWQEQVNAKGGLLGRPVELKIYDDKSDIATAVRLTELLITSDKVHLLISPFGSGATIAASAVNEKHKMVTMNVAGASAKIHERGFKYIIQVVAPSDSYVEGIFPVAQKHGLKSIAFISRDYTASRDLGPKVQELAKQHGLTVPILEYYPAGTTDFSSYITRARQVNPDIWVTIGYQNECIEMVRQMRATNYAPKMFVSNGTSQEDFIKATGKDGEFVFGISLYEPVIKTAGNPDFVRDYKARWGSEPGYYAAMGYATAVIMARAVEQTGGTDHEKLRAALLALKTETPFGPFAVNETGLQVAKKAMIVQVRDGKREIVWPFELETRSPVLPMPAWAQR